MQLYATRSEVRHVRRAFTLVELLVVMAIISILAALLMPVLNTAIEQARKTTCMNNEKQYLQAVLFFADDMDDYMPNVCAPPTSDPDRPLFPDPSTFSSYNRYWNNSHWCNHFWPYIQELYQSDAYSCPSRPQPRWYVLSEKRSSIWSTNAGNRRKVRLPSVPKPFMKMYWVDSYDPGSWRYSFNTYSSGRESIGWHHDRWNGFCAAYLDGHVGFVRIDHQPTSANDAPLENDNW